MAWVVVSSTDSFPHSVWSQNRSYWIGGRREDDFWRWKGIRTGPFGIDRWQYMNQTTLKGRKVVLSWQMMWGILRQRETLSMTMTALSLTFAEHMPHFCKFPAWSRPIEHSHNRTFPQCNLSLEFPEILISQNRIRYHWLTYIDDNIVVLLIKWPPRRCVKIIKGVKNSNIAFKKFEFRLKYLSGV